MQNSRLTPFFTAVVVLFCGCNAAVQVKTVTSRSVTAQCGTERLLAAPIEMREFNNFDVEWVPTASGFTPKLEQRLENIVSALPDGPDDRQRIIQSLSSLLDDPERYIFAHVVLVLYTRSYDTGIVGEWYGLTLSSTIDERGHCVVDQRLAVSRYWKCVGAENQW